MSFFPAPAYVPGLETARAAAGAMVRRCASRQSVPVVVSPVRPESSLCSAWGHLINVTLPGFCARCGTEMETR